jgi:uncharacterized protein DUF3551
LDAEEGGFLETRIRVGGWATLRHSPIESASTQNKDRHCGRHEMKSLLLISIIATATVLATAAKAQNYPWCALYRDGVWNCGFTTFEQCEATRSGNGGFCIQNNTYQPPPGSHPSTKGQRRYPN